ncbi:MAG: MinD/ParA family protein [Armatimonadetes bacterium]|nr:MinD/ParA family protein [Armatimonadota bacterium]
MRTYAVTSGKGGVGKTNISANLAIALADRGQRVVVFDADIGLANLDVVLGSRTQYTLQQALTGEKRLSEVIQVGPGGIRLIAGGSGIESLINLSGPKAEAFLTQLNELERSTDILIFDTGAGIDENVMTFLGAADEILLVATPDPASLTDGYATAKAILARKPDASIRVVMNMVDGEQQGRMIYAKLTSISQQFLGVPLKYAGFVRSDQQALAHIRQRQPFYIANPHLPASLDIKGIAGVLLGEGLPQRHQSFTERMKGVIGGLLKAS